jgi:hypothetical protein
MMNNKRLLPVFLVPSVLVMIPAVAMMMKVEGWAWSPADFVVSWAIIGGAIAAFQIVSSQAPNRAYRQAVGLAVTTGVVLLWINGAVGLIGSEDNLANLMYAGVLVIGLLGSAFARLRSAGMAVAMLVTAVAQFLVPVIAVTIWRPDFSPGVVMVFGLNFIFVLLFAGAALLFRRAGSPARFDR